MASIVLLGFMREDSTEYISNNRDPRNDELKIVGLHN